MLMLREAPKPVRAPRDTHIHGEPPLVGCAESVDSEMRQNKGHVSSPAGRVGHRQGLRC
jgi:hypothetical protein